MNKWLWTFWILLCGMLFATDEFDPEKIKWIGMKMTKTNGIIELNDDSTTQGLYLLSATPISIDTSKNYVFSVKVRKPADATNRVIVIFRVFDKAGKLLKGFGIPVVGKADSEGFITYTKKFAPAEWPAEATNGKILLQPAAGPATGTGKAEFRDIRFDIQEPPQTLEGKEMTQHLFFKFFKVFVNDDKLKCSPFARRASESSPRIEFVASEASFYSTLQLVGRDLPADAHIYLWKEETQSFQTTPLIVPGEKVAGGRAYSLKALPQCHRLGIEFPGRKSLELDAVRVYTRLVPDENWNANWIWFTRTRIDNIDAWLRVVYEFPELPKRAILQCAVDDVADVYVNGKSVGHFSGRSNPPNYDITQHLVQGKNAIAVKVHQFRYSAGFLGELDCRFADGREQKLITDKSWRWTRSEPPAGWTTPAFDDTAWKHCVELCKPPQGEWGKIKYRLNTYAVPIEVLNPSAIPTQVKAGTRCEITLRLKPGRKIPATPLQVILRRGKTIFQTWDMGILPEGDAEVSLPLSLNFHAFHTPGDFILEMKSPLCTYMAGGATFSRKIRLVNDRHAPLCDARLKKLHGVPTLFLNNRPVFSTFSTQSTCSLPLFIKHHRIFHAGNWNLTHLYYIPDWRGNQPDFNALDAYAAALLEGNPDAHILLKVNLRGSQGNYARNHPEECVVFDNGGTRGNCSLASTAWREYITRFITQMIEHIKSSPYADRIIGCCVSEGEEGQWLHYWGVTDPNVPGAFSDYSLPMKRYFRKYLKEKYGSVKKLRAAWNNPDVTFETAEIPDHASRVAHDCGFLRDPVKRRAVIDYAEALSEVVVEGMEHFAKLVKEKTDGRWLTGALYGHILDVGMYMLAEQGGGLAERKALQMPHMDIFMGPLQYRKEFRDLGGVGSYDTPSPHSCTLHDKIWVNENDLRTHLTFPAGYAYSVRATSQLDQVLAREIGKAICSRAGFYLLAMGMEDNHHWYDDPETITTLRELNALAQATASDDRSGRSAIAVFTDDNSVMYMRQLRHLYKEDSLMRYAVIQREAIARIGAPFDEYMQSDLENPALPKYKFYIFLNPIHLTPGEKSKLKSLAKDPTIRILFLFAPGIATEAGLSLQTANELTGMNFTLDATPRKSIIELKQSFGNAKSGTIYGWKDETFAPTPVPETYDRLLAVFPGTDTPAAVTRGNIAFTTLGVLPVELLRHIAVEAGVEIRSKNNIAVFECASYMAIHSSDSRGDFCLKAPKGRKIRQLWPTEEKNATTEHRWKNTSPITKIFKIE